MRNFRIGLIVLCLLLFSAASAPAQVSIGFSSPGVSIGINFSIYPELAPIPGYPVYYAPRVYANYFFYDGLFWVFADGNWYASHWYNGPWYYVDPYDVPLFILRIPVRYYRHPPPFFHGWRQNAPPHWGEHWGHGWEQKHNGWDKWNRRSVPARAPLPAYQRHYSGNSYPRGEQQQMLRNRYYHYRPQYPAVRRELKEQRAPVPAQREHRAAPPAPVPRGHETRQPTPPPRAVPAGPRQQQPPRGGREMQKPAPARPAPQRQGQPPQGRREQPGAVQRGQEQQRMQGVEQRPREPERGQGQGQNKGEERGRGHE